MFLIGSYRSHYRDERRHPTFPYRDPAAELDDLRSRLARTRWANELAPEPAGGVPTGAVPPGWEYGAPLDYVQRLVERGRRAMTGARLRRGGSSVHTDFEAETRSTYLHTFRV